MNKKRKLDILENDLAHFLMEEAIKDDPSKKGSPELYKYKGLSITADFKTAALTKERNISVRIGPLEAEFRVDSSDKTMGNLMPDDESNVMIWMSQTDINSMLRSVFAKDDNENIEVPIIPFDLEEVYEN